MERLTAVDIVKSLRARGKMDDTTDAEYENLLTLARRIDARVLKTGEKRDVSAFVPTPDGSVHGVSPVVEGDAGAPEDVGVDRSGGDR